MWFYNNYENMVEFYLYFIYISGSGFFKTPYPVFLDGGGIRIRKPASNGYIMEFCIYPTIIIDSMSRDYIYVIFSIHI